jgi:hypothetical protein
MFYSLELVPLQLELIVTNIFLSSSKQFVCLFAQLLIKVRPDLPHIELNATWKEKVKAAMVKRYNANLRALDLSRFHTDPGEKMLIHTVCAYINSG